MGNDRIWLSATVRLDCGCEVAHTMSSTNPPEHLDKVLRVAADSLPHHFDRTALTHRCELVSEDNPNGTTQRRSS